MKQVWIVYRRLKWQQLENLKVEGIFENEENADRFGEWAVANWDSKFGVVVQRWVLDDGFLTPYGYLSVADNWRELVD